MVETCEVWKISDAHPNQFVWKCLKLIPVEGNRIPVISGTYVKQILQILMNFIIYEDINVFLVIS